MCTCLYTCVCHNVCARVPSCISFCAHNTRANPKCCNVTLAVCTLHFKAAFRNAHTCSSLHAEHGILFAGGISKKLCALRYSKNSNTSPDNQVRAVPLSLLNHRVVIKTLEYIPASSRLEAVLWSCCMLLAASTTLYILSMFSGEQYAFTFSSSRNCSEHKEDTNRGMQQDDITQLQHLPALHHLWCSMISPILILKQKQSETDSSHHSAQA